MNFKSRKKKGSSLLIVIAMMAIVSIIVISVLVMTSSGYKMRRESNNRVESFYGADSGLEISERVLINYINAASTYANKVVDDDITLVEAGMEKKNEVFKKAFITFFENGGNSAFPPFYKKELSSGEVSTEQYLYDGIVDEIALEDYYDSVEREDVKIQNRTIKYKKKDGTFVDATNKAEIVGMDIHVESEYTAKEKVRNVGVNFEVIVPDYGKTIVKTKGAKAPNIFDYIIGVDGDLDFELANTASVYGDLWVHGNVDNKTNMTLDSKYDGGISIYSTIGAKDPEFALNGGIATGGTLSTTDVTFKSEATANKDIYANNIKMENSDINSTNKLITTKDIYVYNDLILNGNKNQLTTKNYYGLNDIDNYKPEYALSKADRSSSIMINTENLNGEENFIKVNEDAYLLGTSYVDLAEDGSYKTGQSNSINNFTKPYTKREGHEGKYVYDYKGNLHLIDEYQDGTSVGLDDEIIGKDTIEGKVNLAANYKLDKKEEAMANILQVTGEMFNTGATFGNVATRTDKKGIHEPKPPMDTTTKEKQKDYAREVFNMGSDKGTSVNQFWNKNYAESVEGSFKWENFGGIIDQSLAVTSKVDALNYNKDALFIDMASKKTSTEIYDQAKLDPLKPNLIAYKPGVAASQKPHIILSGSNKKLVLKEAKAGGDSLEIRDNEIIYTMDVSKYGYGAGNKPPVLVIAKGDVDIRPINNWNHTMTLTAGTASYHVSKDGVGGIIGNYMTPSVELVEAGEIVYAGGQFNYLNELFKYILQSTDLMGEIGEGIFGNSESKEIIEAIEISDILSRDDWKLIK